MQADAEAALDLIEDEPGRNPRTHCRHSRRVLAVQHARRRELDTETRTLDAVRREERDGAQAEGAI